MKTFKSVHTLKLQLASWKERKLSIGLILTLGNIHEGHLSLVRRSKKSCDVTVVTIFVNPAQFNNEEEYLKYPRNLSEDLNLLTKVSPDAVYIPTASELYINCKLFAMRRKGCFVDIFPPDRRLESRSRPFYFSGYSTLLIKLLNHIQPDVLFLGQKNIEKCYKTKSLIDEMLYSTEIRIVPTVRELNKLAISSNNKLLKNENLQDATALYRTLIYTSEIIRKIKKDAEEVPTLIKKAKDHFASIRTSDKSTLEYICPTIIDDLSDITHINKDTPCILIAAATINSVRLLDNILINCDLEDVLKALKLETNSTVVDSGIKRIKLSPFIV